MPVSAILDALRRSMDLYDELAESLPEGDLARKLPGLRSNTIGEQLWCVVGARESYARALAAGEWSGFSCSLSGADCRVAERMREALAESARALLEAAQTTREADGKITEARIAQLLAVLEHEAAHQGQLIRYLYGLQLPVPPGWKERYALG